jgi:hypothetical protein
MMGAEAPIVKVTSAELEPAELVAVTVKLVAARVALGVPEITQVEELMVSPDGKLGEALQPVIAEPWLLSVLGVMDIAAPTLPLVPVEPT